jgi:hypothetical protein
MIFPQFRKYKNNQSFFHILSEASFIEYKLNGKRLEVYNITASILPDRNFISDMLENYNQHWDKIDQSTFDQFLEEHSAGA